MEVIGTIASGLAILQLAQKINTFRINVKGAEKEWKRYCDGLHTVGYIQNVLDIFFLNSSDYPAIQKLVLTIERDNRKVKVPLVEHVSTVLSKGLADAKELEKRYEQISSGMLNRFKEYWKKKSRRVRLALNKDVIDSMVESIEHACQHLQMALTLVHLSTTVSWQSESRNLLSKIQNDMATHTKELTEKLEKSAQKIHGGLALSVEEDLCHNRGLSSCKRCAKVTPAPKSGTHKSRHILTGPGFSSSIRNCSKSKIRTRSHSLVTIPPQLASTVIDSSEHLVENDEDSVHEGDDASAGGEHNFQYTGNASALKRSQKVPHVSQYEVVSQDGRVFQVPVESASNRPSDGSQGVNQDCHYPPVTSTAVRLERIIESLSEFQWEHVKDLAVGNLTDFLSSAQHTAYATHAENQTQLDPGPPVIIRSECESHIYIAETVVLASCRACPNFCIRRVLVEDNIQWFYVTEPCTEIWRPSCRHLTMNIEDGDVFAPDRLPFEAQLIFWCVSEASSVVLNNGVNWQNDSIASLPGQVKDLALGERHNYTVFDQDGRTGYALPVKVLASLKNVSDDSEVVGTLTPLSEDYVHKSEHDQIQGILPIDIYSAIQTDSESSVVSIARPLSEDSVNENDQHEEQGADTAGLPNVPGHDDDDCASRLLRLITFDDSFEPPLEIETDLLVRFLLLIDRYSQHVGNRPIDQARTWASSSIQFRNTCDTNALAWLWITWKLHLGPEFQSLSSIIQRNAQFQFWHWQYDFEREYGIRLPDFILNQLDARRLQALTRVKNRMTSEIEQYRQQYLDAFESGLHANSVGNAMLSPFICGDVMRSSLVFGYLKLETDRFLNPRHPGLDVAFPEFWGVSFAEVKECILSMQELSDWKICTVPIADRMPAPIAMLTAFIPVVGVGLHNEGLHVHPPRGFKDGLVGLIEEIEKENWGIDLDQIGQ